MTNNLTHSISKVLTVSAVHQHPYFNLEQYNSNKLWEKAKPMR